MKICATELHDERLSSYIKIVNFLLSTFVTDDIIAREIKKSESYKQNPGVSASLYAKRLYTKALGCGIVYEEKCV